MQPTRVALSKPHAVYADCGLGTLLLLTLVVVITDLLLAVVIQLLGGPGMLMALLGLGPCLLSIRPLASYCGRLARDKPPQYLMHRMKQWVGWYYPFVVRAGRWRTDRA